MEAKDKKQLFARFTDCYADTWRFNQQTGIHKEGEVIMAMTEERFYLAIEELSTQRDEANKVSDKSLILLGEYKGTMAKQAFQILKLKAERDEAVRIIREDLLPTISSHKQEYAQVKRAYNFLKQLNK